MVTPARGQNEMDGARRATYPIRGAAMTPVNEMFVGVPPVGVRSSDPCMTLSPAPTLRPGATNTSIPARGNEKTEETRSGGEPNSENEVMLVVCVSTPFIDDVSFR